MPELPEIETIVRGLVDLKGALIKRVFVSDPRLDLPRPEIVGARIEQISRQGKYIVFRFSRGKALIIHLRMSGRLVRTHSSKEEKHVRLTFHLDRGVLHFVDPRRLGTVEFSHHGFHHSLGVDPLAAQFTPARLGKILGTSRAPIKALLMDQKKIAGIGNIYATEALWRAGIDPRRAGNSLGKEDVEAVHTSVEAVLTDALAHMGTTLGETVSDYRDTSGKSGTFQHHFAVYGREGEPCPRCDQPVQRIKQAGRSTYFCPQCQH